MVIFISRDLSLDSIFRQQLEDKATLVGLSLVEFSALAFDKIPDSDWLFFYSKNGIEYCFSQLDTLDNLPPIGVIGKASAEFLKLHYNINAQFVGTGHPKETAAQFLSVANGQKVLFVQAKNSKQSVQKLLSKKVFVESLLVYDNYPKTDFELPQLDVLVFTSPLNVAAYFANYSYQKGQAIISIGRTTEQALKEQGIKTIILAAEPSEKALAACCLALIQKN